MPNPFLLQRYGGALLDDAWDGEPSEVPIEAAPAMPPAKGPSVAPSLADRHGPLLTTHRIVPLVDIMPSGMPMDSSSSDEGSHFDAAVGFASFPNALHMRQTVFQPTRTLIGTTGRVEVLDDDDAPPTNPPARLIYSQFDDMQHHDIEDLIAQTRAAMKAATSIVEEVRSSMFAHDAPATDVARGDEGSAKVDVIDQGVSGASAVAPHAQNLPPATTAAPNAVRPHEANSPKSYRETEAAAEQTDGAQQAVLTASMPLVEHATPPATPAEEQTELCAAVAGPDPTVSSALPLQQVTLGAWDQERVDAIALKHLMRRRPPPLPQPSQAALETAPIRTVQVVNQDSKRSAAKKKTPSHGGHRHGRKAVATPSPAAASTPSSAMVHVDALESIFKSVYALMASKTDGSGTPPPPTTAQQPHTTLFNPYATAASRQTNPIAAHGSKDAAVHRDVAVVMERKPFQFPIPAVPSRFHVHNDSVSGPSSHDTSLQADAQLGQSAPLTYVESSALPRVGVATRREEAVRAPQVQLESGPAAEPKKVKPLERLMQPTESWMHKGGHTVHAADTPSSVSIRMGAHQRRTVDTVVNTSKTREERVSHLNHAAKQLSKHHGVVRVNS